MDLIGTKKFLEAVLPQLGVTLSLTDEMVQRAATVADEVGVFIGEATELVDDASEMVQAAKDAIEAMQLPENTQAAVKAGLAIMSHYMRVGTRASNAAQAMTKLLSAIHERGFKLQIPEER